MTIPAKMHAIQVAGDALEWAACETPRPGVGQVLVRAAATALNRADLLQRAGLYPVPEGASPIMGLEVAGRVVALGEGVTRWRLGDRVCALLAGGGYAEYVVCDAAVMLPVPEGLALSEAAAVPEALYTAYLNIFMLGELERGAPALIHAGASGVGSMAIQLCRALGCPVYATASAGKLALVRELGADAAIDRAAEDFVARVQQLTGGSGVAVILDTVGGPYLEGNLRALRRGGRLVLIGLLGGAAAKLPLGRVLMNNLRIIGSTLRARSVAEKAAITRQILEHVWPLVGAGRIRAVLDRKLPIHQAEAAHALMRANQTAGKVVLEIPG